MAARRSNAGRSTSRARLPSRWLGLIGEYGWDHNVLYILEKDGQAPRPDRVVLRLPLEGSRTGPVPLPRGRACTTARAWSSTATRPAARRRSRPRASIFARRGISTARTARPSGSRPSARSRSFAQEIRSRSRRVEDGEFRKPDLVDLTALDPTIKLDIRYATANNFLGTPLYTSARAFLQRPAAEALLRAHRSLGEQGYGLLIHDAYRPWHVTKMFWDATPESGHGRSSPTRRQGSKHNRGAAVDLTLYDRKTGKPVEMVGGYDEFSPRSNPDYPGGTSLQRWHRDLLRRAMEAAGLHRQRGRVVALRPSRLGPVSDPQPPVRGTGRRGG